MAGKNGGARPGAGRKPGSLNKLTTDFRDKIETDGIIKFLNDVAMGREVDARIGNIMTADTDDFYQGPVKPTIEQRMKASEILTKKTMPDLKAVEHSGAIGIHETMLDELE